MARTFNGTSQYAAVSSGLSLAANDPVWVSAWVWLNSTAAAYGVFALGVSGATNGYRRITATGSGTLVATSANTSAGSASASTSIPGSGQWFHVVGEWGGQATRKITANGGTAGTNTTSINVTTTPSHVRLGATLNLSAYLAGRLAYVGVYSGAPSTQEIEWLSGLGVQTNAFAPNLVATDRLLAYWPLDGASDPEPDDVGSNVLTLVGSPGTAASPSIQLTGSPGGGGNDYVCGIWMWS
jgi:hypothetical protein